MIKYFCDECGVELSSQEVQFSSEMTGKELCSEHCQEYIEKFSRKHWSIKWDWNRDIEKRKNPFLIRKKP